LVKRDDQQSSEQQERAREPDEQGVLEKPRRERPHIGRAQRDDAGNNDEPRPHDPRKGAGYGLRLGRCGHGIAPLRTLADPAATASGEEYNG
jgi:hypothetical protein